MAQQRAELNFQPVMWWNRKAQQPEPELSPRQREVHAGVAALLGELLPLVEVADAAEKAEQASADALTEAKDRVATADEALRQTPEWKELQAAEAARDAAEADHAQKLAGREAAEAAYTGKSLGILRRTNTSEGISEGEQN